MTVQSKYPAGTLSAGGAEFDIFTTSDGQWIADENVTGNLLSAPTRDALGAELRRWVRRRDTKVAIKVLVKAGPSGAQVRPVTVTGIDSRTHGVTGTYDDTGEAANLNTMSTGLILAGTADPDEWQRLLDAYYAAAQAMTRYQDKHKIEHLPRMVREAVTAKLAAGGS